MTTLIDASSRVYRVILLAYPSRLRNEFGSDMLSVFEQQLLDARRDGLTKVLRVWARVLSEIVHVAAPAHVPPASCCIAALSLMTSSALFVLLFWITRLGFLYVK